MKNIKKLLLVFILLLSFILVGCGEFVGYRVSLNYLPNQGSVEIQASQKKDGLLSGDVTIKAIANEGFQFVCFENVKTKAKDSSNPLVINSISDNFEFNVVFEKIITSFKLSIDKGVLSWEKVSGESQYEIYVDGNCIDKVDGTSYILSKLDQRNEAYSIKVKAVTRGVYSNEVTYSNPIIVDSGSNIVIEGTYDGKYYDGIDLQKLNGDILFSQLRSLITKTHTTKTTYEDLKTVLAYTDASLEDESKLVLFYAQQPFDSTWRSGNTWNREHVWPQSKGWFKTSGAGSDAHHIRPTDNLLNSTRGNDPYAIVTGGKYLTSGTSTGNIPTQCKSGSGKFEPADSIKGDVARILMYLLVRYPESDGYTINIVCTNMDLLLEWNKLDPVDAFEARRNERTAEVQGNRNPFIDYPALAEKIWR